MLLSTIQINKVKIYENILFMKYLKILVITRRRKPMVPNKLEYTFRFKFYISIKAVPKTKLLDAKATRTTAYHKKGHSSETLCFKEK